MASFAEMQADCYFFLGTTSSDQAFPPAKIQRCLNIAKDKVCTDAIQCNPDAFHIQRTLTSSSRTYDLTTMSPAIRDVQRILDVRVTDGQGQRLDERPYADLERNSGSYLYAAIGPNSAMSIVTSRAVREGVNLFFAYVPMVADLAADSDTVTVVPANFHDVISLEAAKIAAGSGDEQGLSSLYADLLMDRSAQLWQHLGQRSIDPTVRRTR